MTHTDDQDLLVSEAGSSSTTSLELIEELNGISGRTEPSLFDGAFAP